MAAEPTSKTYISKIKVGNTTYDIKNTTYSIDTSAGNVITLTGSDGTSVSKTLVTASITLDSSQVVDLSETYIKLQLTDEQYAILCNEANIAVSADASALGLQKGIIFKDVVSSTTPVYYMVLIASAQQGAYCIHINTDKTAELYEIHNVPDTRKINGHELYDDITLTKSDIGLGNVNNTADANKSVASATKATQDANGNVITTTYATKSEIPTTYVKTASVSGNDLTLTDASGNATTFSPSMESAVSSVNGKTGAVTLSYSDVGAQVAGDYQAAGNYISYTNATADVAGTSKTVSKTNPQTLFVPNGLIMGGTAAAAGLTTRGICGVTTPDSSTGACAKENLYLNYDSDSTYQNGRKVVLGAGGTGTALTGGAYTYCAVRGDEMVAYVSSAIAGKANNTVTVQGSGALGGSGTLSSNITITHNAGNAANKTSGLYKFSTDAYSHVNSVTAVSKADITNLGIPAQDTTYTAGTNIDITNNVISATDTTYTAGTNVQISDDNTISATDTTYSAGDNITIDSNNKISSDAIIKLQDNGTTTAGVWLAKTDQISAYVDGQVFLYKITKAGGSTTTLNINGLGAKPVYRSATTALTTHYGVGQYILLTYNTQNTCFRVTNFYDSTDTDTLRTRYFRPYAAEAIYRYKLVALDEENRLVPIVTTNQTSSTQVAKTPTTKAFKPHNLWYYNTTSTSTAGTVVIDATLYWQGAGNTFWPYNFNESVPAYRLVYLRGTYDKDTDLFTLYNDGSSPCKSYYVFVPTNAASITLSDYFVSGYYYWLIAGSYSAANQAALLPNKELYYFDGTNLTPVQNLGDPTPTNMVTTDTTQTITAPKTFASDVFFEKARFTEDGVFFTADEVKFGDTAYLYIPSTSNINFKDESGGYSGDTLATLLDAKQDSISDLSTIRTNASNGATAYTNLNGHTVNSDVPSGAKFTDTTYSFSASNPTLSWGTTSTIGTAGGTTYKVTMPANPNTNQTVKVGTTTFGASDAVTIAGGGDISVAGDSTNKKITISYTKPTIDSSLSTTSANAVQNSIVTSAINSKADSSALGDQVTFSYDSTTGTLTISPK